MEIEGIKFPVDMFDSLEGNTDLVSLIRACFGNRRQQQAPDGQQSADVQQQAAEEQSQTVMVLLKCLTWKKVIRK